MDEGARSITVKCRFRGNLGQEALAAEQWATEMTLRMGLIVTGEPGVSCEGGVYTVGGPVVTDNPLHRAEAFYDEHDEPWDLAWCSSPSRVATLRKAVDLYRRAEITQIEYLGILALLDPSPRVRAVMIGKIA